MERQRGASVVVAGIVAGLLGAAGLARADTLSVALREMPAGGGDPFSASMAAPGLLTWSAVYEQLTRTGEGGVSKPLLATSWRNVDPTTWEFQLRPDVTFATGEPLDTIAVKQSFDYLLKTEAGQSTFAGQTIGGYVSDVLVRRPNTLVIRTHRPQPLTPRLIQPVTILPPRALADEGLASFATHARGSGPYVATFERDRATGTPNPNWRGPRGDVDRIAWSVQADDAARLQALLSGQVDIDTTLSPAAATQVRQAGMTVLARRAARTIGITLVSMRRPAVDRPSELVRGPLADVRVRRALNHAVNKQTIVDGVFAGHAAPATQSAPSVVNGYNRALKPYDYNPSLAKQLLSDAGYPDGFALEVHAVMADGATAGAYEAAVQDLNRIGLRATLVPQSQAEFSDHYLKGNWPYGAFGFGHNLAATLDASQAFLQYTSCRKIAPYYCNEAEMPLIEQFEVAFNERRRLALLAEALEMNRANAPILYLVEPDDLMGYGPRIKKIDSVNGWIAYEKISLIR